MFAACRFTSVRSAHDGELVPILGKKPYWVSKPKIISQARTKCDVCAHMQMCTRIYHVSASAEALPAGNDFAMPLLGGLDLYLHCVQLIQPIRDAWNINYFRIAGVIIELKERSGKLRGKGYKLAKRNSYFFEPKPESTVRVCLTMHTYCSALVVYF